MIYDSDKHVSFGTTETFKTTNSNDPEEKPKSVEEWLKANEKRNKSRRNKSVSKFLIKTGVQFEYISIVIFPLQL